MKKISFKNVNYSRKMETSSSWRCKSWKVETREIDGDTEFVSVLDLDIGRRERKREREKEERQRERGETESERERGGRGDECECIKGIFARSEDVDIDFHSNPLFSFFDLKQQKQQQ